MINETEIKTPSLFELFVGAGIAIFTLGFCLGYSLKIEKKYEFKPEVFSVIDRDLFDPRIDDIRQASWRVVGAVEGEMESTVKTEENIFFAPILSLIHI